MPLEKIDPQLFTWSRWRIGSPLDVLGIECRKEELTSKSGKAILISKAIGWCSGEELICRPKAGCIAVMFWLGDGHYWFHLRQNEFKVIWKGLNHEY